VTSTAGALLLVSADASDDDNVGSATAAGAAADETRITEEPDVWRRNDMPPSADTVTIIIHLS